MSDCCFVLQKRKKKNERKKERTTLREFKNAPLSNHDLKIIVPDYHFLELVYQPIKYIRHRKYLAITPALISLGSGQRRS